MSTNRKLISALHPGQKFRIVVRVADNTVIELSYYRGRLKNQQNRYQILLFAIVVKVSDFVLWQHKLSGNNEIFYADVKVDLI